MANSDGSTDNRVRRPRAGARRISPSPKSPTKSVILNQQMRKAIRVASLPHETEWAEWKHNNDNPQEIGEYISALANSAALAGEAEGILLWGVADDTQTIVGTTFRPNATKVSGQELKSWLLNQLSPRVDFSFEEMDIDGKRVVMLIIPRAAHTPVAFKGTRYIRVGSYKKELKDYSEKERSLWRLFDQYRFEEESALREILGNGALALLDSGVDPVWWTPEDWGNPRRCLNVTHRPFLSAGVQSRSRPTRPTTRALARADCP